MSISVSRVSQLTVTETYSSSYASSGDNTITVNGLNGSGNYTASTTVTVTKYAIGSKAMTAGAATIDLTAVADAVRSVTVDATGLRVQFCILRNPPTNANDIVVTFGASNAYLLFGAAFKITLKPGQNTGPWDFNAAAPVISSSLKNIDISGTGTQALEYEFIFS